MNKLNFTLPVYQQELSEPIIDTIKRFVDKGVYIAKIIPTIKPSAVIWSKSKKCIVGDVDQPPLEVITDENGNSRISIENNAWVTLQIRTELTEDDVREINESEGIIVTNATYGKPYFRYGFVPQ